MTFADPTTVHLDGDTDIVASRRFDAPLHRVYRALHEPELVRRWWCPQSRGRMTECTIEFRVGGSWRFAMETLDGRPVGFSGKYLEISDTRVVNTEVFDPFPDLAAVVTTTLEEAGGQTLLTVRSRYPSREVRDMVVATGMEDGMRESWRQLGDVVTG
ncbi:MAG: SRPBCC family protein [Myxococcota bacterium]